MNHVRSIELIEKGNIIDTACKPVLTFCKDLEFYFCKYNTGFSSADMLLREYLCAAFLKEWRLTIPDFAFVTMRKEDIPLDIGMPFRYFERICFGSKKLDNATDVNRFLIEVNSYQKSKFNKVFDYLKIALFDLWIANDDRNHNNYNLLLKAENGKYKFVPIDHEKAFNTGNLDKGLYTITEDSSLITAPLCLSLFTAKDLANRKRIEEFKDYFYLCILSCKNKIPEIIKEIPEDWQINLAVLSNDLSKNLFAKKWIDECWNTFVRYLQFTINKLTNNKNNGNSL